MTEVDFDALAHDGFAIKDLSNANSGIVIEEGDNYSAKGAEGSPRVDRSGGIDEIFDGLQVVCAEDLRVLQVGY